MHWNSTAKWNSRTKAPTSSICYKNITFSVSSSTRVLVFCTTTCTYLINCIQTPFLNNTSTFENLHKHRCDISIIRVFGCLCYASTITAHCTLQETWSWSSSLCNFLQRSFSLHSSQFYSTFFFTFFTCIHFFSFVRSSTLTQVPNIYTDTVNIVPSTEIQVSQSINIRHSNRSRQPLTYLQDYHQAYTLTSINFAGISYPLENFLFL